MTEKDLKLVRDYQKETILFVYIGSLLNWDQQTYMPKKGINSRAEQSSILSSLIHKKLTSNELFSALKRLKNKKLSFTDAIMVKRLYKIVDKSRKVPEKFVKELSKAKTLAFSAWERAREKNDFGVFSPHLEKLVKLKQQEARYVKLPDHLYNSLIDEFEEGMTVEKLKPIFERLKKELIVLIKKIEASSVYKNQKSIMDKKFDRNLQLGLCKDVMKKIGLDEESSRIDTAQHPFTATIGTEDIRITTNVREHPLFAFESTIHEAGHALYEKNMPKKYNYTVLRSSPSMGLHESQSRFWENMISKSKLFLMYYFPLFKKNFNLNENFEDWYKLFNLVTPGMIRVESDEIHYCLHIILRFEIEMGLMDGTIKVKDLPQIWNKKMNELFGFTPENDNKGVLQDVHWSEGWFGYFPSYAIGSIYAAQLYDSLKRKIPEIDRDIEKGDFTRISTWLADNVHKYGFTYLAEEIIKKACGEGLNPEVYIKYLTNKYKEIYKF